MKLRRLLGQRGPLVLKVPPNTLPPAPPADLDQRNLPIDSVVAGSEFFRIHQRNYAPLYFGREAIYRFDDPTRQFGVCYTAHDLKGAFAETCLREVGISLVSTSYLQERDYSILTNDRPLSFIKLYGNGLAQLGATAAVTSGNYNVSQPWAKALHDHPQQADGIAYMANHDNSEICYAFFDRTAAGLSIKNTFDLLHDETLIGSILDHYGVALG